MKIKVVLQTKNYIIVHKPEGFLVYADSKEDQHLSLQEQLQVQLKKKIIPVHRLDKQTCGLILYAFNKEAAARLKQMFQSKKIEKTYLAFCHGEVEGALRIDAPLKKNKQKVTEKAVTNVECLRTISVMLRDEERKYSLVKCYPETGRYHQIRRHLKLAKHPIVGDSLYGNSWNNEVFKQEFHIDRTLLSAICLKFKDPWTKQNIIVQTKPDFDFANILNIFSISGYV